MEHVPVLPLLVLIPAASALFLLLVGREGATTVRTVSFMASGLTFLVSLSLLGLYDPAEGGLQLRVEAEWIPSLGISWSLGVDGVTLWLVLLTTFLVPISILASWRSIQTSVCSFHICLLFLEAAMIATFLALDLVLFYVAWEAMLVPMALLIGIWGGGRRVYSAIKFFLFTAAGSLPMLAAILYLYHAAGAQSFSYEYLRAHLDLSPEVPGQAPAASGLELLLFGCFALAFAVKVPIWPLHTWLPDAHSDAPTAGSVILAAVLLKMGLFGFIRFGLGLFPQAASEAAPFLSVLAVIGILYGSLLAMAQTDFKRLVACSSVAHLGFCTLGLFALTQRAVEGAVLQMVNHGISTGALFLLVGMIYDRRHTRDIDQYGGLARVTPTFAALFLVITLSSIGLPGTNGFAGEFLILAGSFPPHPGLTVAATLGVVLGAVYMLRLYHKMFWGKVTRSENAELKDLNLREKVVLWPLVLMVFLIGLGPTLFTRYMTTTVSQILAAVLGGGS